jgi:Na+/melibiose symporter-like transporter
MTGFDFMIFTPLSLLGIRIEKSIIPTVIILSFTIVFMLLYDLNPEKIHIIQEGLKTLQI